MKQFEYKHVPKKFPGLSLEELNELGKEGWMMCGSEKLIEPYMYGEIGETGKIYIFQREIEFNKNKFIIKFFKCGQENIMFLTLFESGLPDVILTTNKNDSNIISFNSLQDAKAYIEIFIKKRKYSLTFRKENLAYNIRKECMLSIVEIDNILLDFKVYQLENVEEK